MDHGASTIAPDVTQCGQRMWPVFLASCLVFAAVMGLGLAVARLIWAIRDYRRSKPRYKLVADGRSPGPNKLREQASCMSTVKFIVGEFMSASTFSGKAVAFLEFGLGMTVLFIYYARVSRYTSATVESCVIWSERLDLQIEFVCNIILLCIFILRFIGAMDTLEFLISLDAIVTYFTIPPSFVTVILSRDWIGLRCLRACHLLSIPRYVFYSRLIRKATLLRLMHICTIVATVILVAAGIFHLLDLTGDDWVDNVTGKQEKTYWEWVYMSVVTLSTVGYGDISPKSTLGQVFCVMFIIGALALFASSIPEIHGIISNLQKFTKPYRPARGTQHIIVSGNITIETMRSLVNDLSRPDRRQRKLDIVFVNPEEPDIEMKSFLKEVQTYVRYVEGSLLHAACLQNTKVHEAEAYLHLANRRSDDPEKDDSTTLLTVASVKSANPYLRCVVQILQSSTKSQFSSIPGFLMKRGDAVICFQELELALTAQNCLAPGSSTLLSNLIRAFHGAVELKDAPQEMHDYLQGCHMELHSGPFTAACHGMTFFQAAEFCYSKLNVVLIGTFSPARTAQNGTQNGPLLCNANVRIEGGCIGIFLARSAIHARRVHWYCQSCHEKLPDITQLAPCNCENGVRVKQLDQVSYRHLWDHSHQDVNNAVPKYSKTRRQPLGWEDALMHKIRSDATVEENYSQPSSSPPTNPRHAKFMRKESVHANTQICLDVSRNFYWCESRPFASVLLDRRMALDYPLSGHIVVLISSHPDDPPMGLRDFVVPMRSSRIPYDEVKEIVLLGNAEYLHREWPQLRNLPLVTVVDGDPLNRADLRAVSIKTASVCVVLSAWTGKSVDPVLDDKTAVLTTLNVRAMPFDHPEGMDAHFELPIVTALQHNRNVRLLSEDASSEVEVRESFMMEPFMCGQTVTISALYSLISTSYFTPLAVPVVEHLLYGFQSPVMESYLAEGVGLMGGDEYNPDELSPYNIRVRLITVRDGPWTQSHSHTTSTTNLSYGELFVHALHSSMVCLGISRMFQPENATTAPKRIIISNPPRQTVLRWDDQVYVLTK